MTKTELLEIADGLGLAVTSSNTKAEIISAILGVEDESEETP